MAATARTTVSERPSSLNGTVGVSSAVIGGTREPGGGESLGVPAAIARVNAGGRLQKRFRIATICRMTPRIVDVRRYVTPLREGGSLPAIVEADDLGLYVLKFRGSGQGPKALIAEWVAGEIARALGLEVPEIVLATLDVELARTEADPEIQSLMRASAGLNLALDYLPGSVTFDPRRVAAGCRPRIAYRLVRRLRIERRSNAEERQPARLARRLAPDRSRRRAVLPPRLDACASNAPPIRSSASATMCCCHGRVASPKWTRN